jgi:hypothetical protein
MMLASRRPRDPFCTRPQGVESVNYQSNTLLSILKSLLELGKLKLVIWFSVHVIELNLLDVSTRKVIPQHSNSLNHEDQRLIRLN